MEYSDINDSSELASEIQSHEGEQHLDQFHSKDSMKLKNVIRNVVKEECGCFFLRGLFQYPFCFIVTCISCFICCDFV